MFERHYSKLTPMLLAERLGRAGELLGKLFDEERRDRSMMSAVLHQQFLCRISNSPKGNHQGSGLLPKFGQIIIHVFLRDHVDARVDDPGQRNA